ncbi:MFS transporter [Streptomyces sp. NBC_00525]|uniref:MFS transporter n=1 Tax=Streptomyces sp. NBC_00525 TaxID=2903660 RepID=UPI002E806092|nr:MFS transporter [Streptomyces sp. NBC_00525]WUC92147.1 MFS transporter [Streptomyces sp. NBC_00525]
MGAGKVNLEKSDKNSEPLRKNRDFSLLWTSQAASELGSTVSILAFPLLILSIHGSAVLAGAVGSMQAVIRAVLQLPAGALADRWNRRTLMLGCDAGRVVLFMALGGLVLVDHASVPVIFMISGCVAVLDVMFVPGEAAAVSQLVGPERVSEAFAKNEARTYAASLAGPSLGGLLYSIGRAIPFLFDALTYIVSFTLISRIRRPLQQPREGRPKGSLVRDILEGLKYVVSSPFLRGVLFTATPINFALVSAQFSVTLALTESGYTPAVLGMAQGVIAVGGLLGALSAPWIQGRVTFYPLLLATVSTLFVLMVVSALSVGRFLMVLPLALGLFLAPAINAALFGRLAVTTPNHLQGRVISVVVLLATASASAAPLSSGMFVERLGSIAAMTSCVVAVALSLFAALYFRGLRIEKASHTDPFPN